MSYDIQLVINTGGERPAPVTERRSPTYNLGKMFALALGCPIRELEGRNAANIIYVLQKAIEETNSAPAKFKKLNPPNGWGKYEDALETLCWLLVMCEEHPLATVEI